MADFKIAYYDWIKPAEGGYGWLAGDSGGETYAGISRNYNPDWKGWSSIDFEKKSKYGGKPLPNNYKIPSIDYLVVQWYNDFWNKNNFGRIANQDVANILFDWFVNSGSLAVYTPGTNTYGIDEILNRDYNAKLPTDKKVDLATVNAINNVKDQNRLHDTIKKERINFYKVLDATNPEIHKANFLPGWLNRINKFPTLSTTIVFGGAALVLILLVTLILFLYLQ